ncbi:MAG TPA: nucleotidyltransferase domain-containing protein [Firmicutes bacterium]|nr:nucleotidyltransferase domain-containing protein [Bacillota bacterium]
MWESPPPPDKKLEVAVYPVSGERGRNSHRLRGWLEVAGLPCIDLEAEARSRRRELERELGRIVSRCRDLGYRKVVLFGSLARGEVGPWSDIDLILVKETDKRFLDRLDEFYRAVVPKTAVDVLIYTPEEFAELSRSREFVKQAVAEGVVLVDEEGVGRGRGEVAKTSREQS